mmetsp:Transcript_27732/g.36084  ORF Transcript_27732/g.36084 Transcript_27732/m.36084 type:complete len:209 (-) Transcript_27732:248-874(-)|eukprot:CAMPEP_0117759718 /NCGR_PEP_ID=MMETSP0947-20121206/16177_1 /TAXON_ID=44440 /ORGANISM="Chattonella subsalsa, Strain CCMP2191" /LENGTH=208 /DNA_ID=CAMNT_0005580223 /DNA_START=24 /DNA_END=650 /DNA_ORIENTATION=-
MEVGLTSSKYDSVLNGLKNIGEIDERTFDSIIGLISAQLSNCLENINDSASSFGEGESQTVQNHRAYASLATLLIESAKVDTVSEEFSSLLEEHGVPLNRQQRIAALYEELKPGLRQDLIRTGGSGLPALVGANWRLDYCIRSSNLGEEHRPAYTLKLEMMDRENGQTENIQLTCSLEELEELQSKVRAATKQVERICASNSDLRNTS